MPCIKIVLFIAAVKTRLITRQESQFYMTCISTISIVRKNWIPGIDNTRMTLLWRLTFYTMWCFVVTALYLYSLTCHELSTVVTCHVFSVTRMFTAPVSGPDWGGQWPGEPAPGCHAASPASSPVSQSTLYFSRARRNSLITRAPGSDSPSLSHHLSRTLITRVLPDNSKYVRKWWCVVRRSINNSSLPGHESHKCTHWVIRWC